MSRFAIQQIKFNNTLYPGVSGFTVNPGQEINSDQLDGTVHETAHHGMETAPVADLSTRNLGFLSTLADSTDVWVKAMDGTNGLELIGAKAASQNAGYASGSVHLSRKMIRGVLLGTALNWSKKGKAELVLKGMGISADGTTPALSPSLIALPALPTPDFGWKLQALTLNGSAMSAVDSCNITVDPKAEFDYQTSLPEPIDVLMAGVNGPAIWRLLASVGDCDLGSGTGAVSAVYKRLANGGGWSVAANSTLTVTFNSNWSIEESVGGQVGGAMNRSLVVRPYYNGTTKPVTWAFS